MKTMKKLALVLAASILLSALEVVYIVESPLLGVGDIEAMKFDYERVRDFPRYNDSVFVQETNELYAALYRARPHTKDPSTAYYKTYALGVAMDEVRGFGDILWRIGVFDDASSYPWVVEGLSDSYLFRFSEIGADKEQQQALMKELHEVLNSLPEGSAGLGFEVGGKNLTIRKGDSVIARLEIENGALLLYYSTDRSGGYMIGVVVEREGDYYVYSDSYQKILAAYGPAATASQFYPGLNEYSCVGSAVPFTQPGEMFSIMMPLGWLVLADMSGDHYRVLFDERFPVKIRMGHGEFVKQYAYLYDVLLQRMSFIESVLDEEQPRSGILYAAYYPQHQRMLVLTKSIAREDLEEVRLMVDGAQIEFEALHPFLYAKAPEIADGRHVLKLATPSAEYETFLDVESAPIRIPCASVIMRDNGSFKFIILNLDASKKPVYLKDVQASWYYGQYEIEFGQGLPAKKTLTLEKNGEIAKEINQELSRYDMAHIEMEIPERFQGGDDFRADITVRYSLDGREREYRTKISAQIEG